MTPATFCLHRGPGYRCREGWDQGHVPHPACCGCLCSEITVSWHFGRAQAGRGQGDWFYGRTWLGHEYVGHTFGRMGELSSWPGHAHFHSYPHLPPAPFLTVAMHSSPHRVIQRLLCARHYWLASRGMRLGKLLPTQGYPSGVVGKQRKASKCLRYE